MFVNRPLVVFGPSGVGKGTLLARLFADCPDTFSFSVSRMPLCLSHGLADTTLSDTTRQPRPGETDGKEYHFVSTEKFRALLADHAFIEHAQFSANFYGTSRQAIGAVRESGRRCVLDIDSQVRLSGTRLHHRSPPSRASSRSSRQISTPSTSSFPHLTCPPCVTDCAAVEPMERTPSRDVSPLHSRRSSLHDSRAHVTMSLSTMTSTGPTRLLKKSRSDKTSTTMSYLL